MMKVLVFSLAAVNIFGQVHPNPPSPPDGQDECRPQPPSPGSRVVCCADSPKTFDPNSGLEKIFDKCRSEMESSEAGGPPDIDCMTECLFKNLNLLDSNNKLELDSIKQSMAKSFTGEWVEIGAKALESCVTSSLGEVKRETKCRSGAEEFLNCFSRVIFLNCPESKWNSDATCTALKETAAKCPNFPTFHLF